jgi:glycosyltransferase involved in cell wall biosynthesis
MRKTSKKLIVFAIPSLNEADTISQLTKIIDLGLLKYFRNCQSVIINADNDSPDNTKEAFLKTPTKHKKIYLTTKGKPKNIRGKGFQMQMVFKCAQKMNADAVGFIDGDVTSATPDWVTNLITPILNGYDHVLPIYRRNEYDGSLTNHIVFPVLYGLLSTNIRQPLAGEISLSKRAIEIFLSEKWHNSANHYGVDIFMVTQSIFHNLRIAQTFLGSKNHKPSAPKLDKMFLQVTDSLFRQLKKHESEWKTDVFFTKAIPLFKKPPEIYNTPELPFDYKKIKENALKEYGRLEKYIFHAFKPFAKRFASQFVENRKINMPMEFWAKIVYYMISKKNYPSEKELLAFRVFFFARFLTFYKSVIDKNHEESEREIIKQAKVFRKMRKLAVLNKLQ